MILFYLLWANLADLDYLPGLVVGKPNVFHHQITHSLGAAVLMAVVGGLLWPRRGGKMRFTFFVVPFVLYLSHLVLDYLCADSRAPYGLQLLWPLTDDYYISPVSLFLNLHKGQTSGHFFTSLFAWQNLKAILVEFLWLTPVVFLVGVIVGKRGRRGEGCQ